MADMQRIRVTYRERSTNKMKDKFYDNVDRFNDVKLNKVLQEVRMKGIIIEVWQVDGQDNPIDEVRWKHLY